MAGPEKLIISDGTNEQPITPEALPKLDASVTGYFEEVRKAVLGTDDTLVMRD